MMLFDVNDKFKIVKVAKIDDTQKEQFIKTLLDNISPLLIVTFFNPEQPPKALLPIDLILLGNVNSVKPEQYAKALLPIDLILLGNVNCVKPEQQLKAPLPIYLILSGSVNCIKLEQ